MKRKHLILSVIFVGLLALLYAGCSSWERTTYQTLAASKATIDRAASDYRAGKIPQSQQTYELILKARAADTLAVDAFGAYAALKVGGGSSTALGAARAKVITVLDALSAAIGPLETLLTQEAQAVSLTRSPPARGFLHGFCIVA